MNTISDTPETSVVNLNLKKAVTEKKETLSHELVDKSENLHIKTGDLVSTVQEKETVKQELVVKADDLHQKTGVLVDVAKQNKVVDENLVKAAEESGIKNKELEEVNKILIGREGKMIEQKKKKS